MKVRKKLFYYIICIAAIAVICLFSGLFIVGDREYSVIEAILFLPMQKLGDSDMKSAFGACYHGWLYLLMPVVVSAPSVSYIYDEIKSRFYISVWGRMGKYRYLYSRYIYSVLSGATAACLGILLYTAIISCFFGINPTMEIIGYEDKTLIELILCLGKNILYISLYGGAMSLLASFIIFIYNNLYFSLSMVFIISYMLRDCFVRVNFIYPAAGILMFIVLYAVMWRFRGERV